MEDPAAGGRDPAVDASLADGLTRHTGVGIDILRNGRTKRNEGNKRVRLGRVAVRKPPANETKRVRFLAP